jgi:Zn-dependent protease
MENKKEIALIGLVILIISFSISINFNFSEDWKNFGLVILIVSTVISLNILAKEMMAYILDAKVEHKLWEIKTPDILERLELRRIDKSIGKSSKLSLGIILPIISKIILFPFNSFVWMSSLIFDVTPRAYRGAKRYGLYTFSNMTEAHIGYIAAAGVFANLALSVISYLIGAPYLARISLYFAFFNILPISELDGNKIFFGNKLLWSFLTSLVLIGLFFSVFII